LQSFTELDLSPELMRAITELGYEKPSPIQAEALPLLLGQNTDFLGLAATGTGKTAAFGLPLLERVDPSKRAVQGLILCPTRELAVQVAGQIDLLGKYKGVRALPIYGGAPYGDQINGLKRGATIVVGTPGRLCDHLDKGTLSLKNLEVLILDEADEMISMGFKDDLEKILQACGQTQESEDGAEESQRTNDIWLFSATMSREVRHVADEYLSQPKQVQINKTEMLSGTVEQLYYITQESNKPEILCKLVEAAEDFYGLVFCQTKSLVTDLTRFLAEKGYKVDCLHGDMDQKARERTMQAFRDRKVSMLICTDVASRGLDVKDITHVINYSIPRELDNYVHRIGRTGRSGKAGIAMSLVTPSHRVLVGRIEKMTKSRMTEGRVPTRKEIGAKKVALLLTKFQEQANFARATELLGPTWKEALEAMSSEEIASRFMMLTFPDLFNDKNKEVSQERMSAYGSDRGGERSYGDRGGGRGGRYGDRGSDRDRGAYAGGYTSGGDLPGGRPRNTDRGARAEYNPNPQIAGEHKFQILKMEQKPIAPSGPSLAIKIPTARTEFKAEAKAEIKIAVKHPMAKPAHSGSKHHHKQAPSAKHSAPKAHAAPAKPHAAPAKPAQQASGGKADGSPWDQYKKGDKSSSKKAKKRAWDKPLSK
jgi:ATP-dependent RNA helicase DeaD